jgi:hypothetical protein
MSDERRARDAYDAMLDPAAWQAAFEARRAQMLAGAHTWDQLLVSIDVQLSELIADAVAQGLPVPEPPQMKDYKVFTRQIFRVSLRHPFNILSREFGGFVALWVSRGLQYEWLRRIGSVIFGIPEGAMDHALLTHLAFEDAGHTGFAPSPAGSPSASAPGDSSADGTSSTPSHSDHKHAREAFGTSAGTVCEGDDARLSDTRNPKTHNNTVHQCDGSPESSYPGDAGSQGTSSLIARLDHKHGRESYGSTGNTICEGNDARLSNARTPTTHGNDKHSFFGSSFPGSPSTGDVYFHTTLNDWFYYNGTNWVSCRLYSMTLNNGPAQPNNDSKEQAHAPRQPLATNMLIEFLDWAVKSDTAQSDTKYCTYTLTREPSGISLGSFDTKAGTSANTWFGGRVTIGAASGTSDIAFSLTNTRTSTPGNLSVSAVIRYRIIGG